MLKHRFFLEGGVIWLKNETLYLIKKQRRSLQTKKTKSNELFQEELSIVIFLGFLESTIAFKLKSIGQFFASFNPVPSSPTRADDKNFIQLTKTVTVKEIAALDFIYTDLFLKPFIPYWSSTQMASHCSCN